MVLNPQKVLDEGIVVPCSFTKRQQNGIDLTLEEDLELKSGESKNIFLNESVAIPENVCAELKIRSTYSRKGLFLSSGLWDSGFHGQLGCTIYNMSGTIITVPADERICQIVCYQAESAELYKGQYNGLKHE